MPILDAHSFDFVSHSADQTQRLGMRLGELLSGENLLCLTGELGAGKTTLAAGIARGWGALDRPSSPGFVIVNEYRRADRTVLFHLDAYRLTGPQEAWAAGVGDLFDGRGDVLVEWPERILDALPPERLWIALGWVEEQKRSLHFEAAGPRYQRLLDGFRQAAFGR